MQRYQIYLDPASVGVTDNLARALDISRSQIIREAIERIMREYRKILFARTAVSLKSHPLLKMAGFAKSPTNNVSLNVDEIYSRD